MLDSPNIAAQHVRVTQVDGATTHPMEINQRVSNTGFSSSITSRQQWSCTTAIKNFFYRIYDVLCKCIPFLPKRQQQAPVQQPPSNDNEPYPRVRYFPGSLGVPGRIEVTTDPVASQAAQKLSEGITKIKQDAEYQKDPKQYIWNLLKANGHYRYHTGDSVLDHFLQYHQFTHYEPEGIIFHKNFAKEIDKAMQQIKREPEYIKDPKKYVKDEIALLEALKQASESVSRETRYQLHALWELEKLLGERNG
jgi:hypothetical protein